MTRLETPRPARRLALLLSLLAVSCGGEPGPLDVTDARLQLSTVGHLRFITQRVTPSSNMEALYTGGLDVDEQGCIRLASPDAATVIWPRGYSLSVVSGMALVRDETGAAVGLLDGDFSLGGGEVPELPAAMGFTAGDREMAGQVCPGRYWIAS